VSFIEAQLKCLYANARSEANKQEQLETCACMQGSDLMASWRRGGIAPMPGVLEWNDTGFIGRTGRENEDRV